MTIRFTCPECSSILKIKDDLAGTGARCPKCKRKFVVPAASLEESAEVMATVGSDGQKSKQSDSKKDLLHPMDEDSLSSTEVMTISEESSTDDLLEKINLKRRQSSSDSSDDVAEQKPSKRDRKPLTDEFRSYPTVADAPFAPKPEDGVRRHLGDKVNVDDDLDCSAMLISNPGPDEDEPAEPPKKKRNSSAFLTQHDHAKPPSSSEIGTDRSTKKTVPRSFDPAKFMAEEARPKNRGPRSPYPDDDDSDIGLSGDSDLDVFNPPPPRPSKPPSGAAIPSVRPTPEKVDLAAAAKMMKKAIKDAQSDATRQRQRDASRGFDYGLIFREIGLRGLAIIVGMAVMVFASIQVGRFVFKSSLKTPPLAVVYGSVTLDGKPLSDAKVYFRPVDPTMKTGKRDQKRTSIGTSDQSGHYEMLYDPKQRIRGVAVGECFFWVEHERSDIRIPGDWSEFARRKFTVKAGESPEVNIKMQSERR